MSKKKENKLLQALVEIIAAPTKPQANKIAVKAMEENQDG